MKHHTYKPIEERCEEVLRYISDTFFQRGTSPSYDEICKAIGIKSKGHLAPIIDKLVEEGRLEREEGIARGLRLPGWTPNNLFSIPLKGQIAASNENPLIVLDEFDSDTTVEIPPELVPKTSRLSELYALTVVGDSMNDAMIADGDIVILQQGDRWNDGDMVAIWLHGQQAVTLKALYRSKGDSVKLKPRSHKHQVRVEREEDIKVMGRVVALMRKHDIN